MLEPPRTIKGNEPQTLDDESSVWRVERGRVALFACRRDGRSGGGRRYLFSVGEQEALFSSTGGDWCLLAVPLVETVLQRLPVGPFLSEPPGLEAMESWVHKLGNVFSGFAPPEQLTDIAQSTVVRLEAGQSFQVRSHGFSWLKIERGTLHLCAEPTLALEAGTSRLPIGSETWMTAVSPTELVLVDPVSLAPEAKIAGLALLHWLVFAAVELLEAREREGQLRRFAQRQQHDYQITEDALRRLASVTSFQAVAPEEDGPPLYAAMRVIGKAIGAEIKPPARSENFARLRTPVEAIARASRIRLRRVVFSTELWGKDCGPLLAFMGSTERPVALIPSPHGRYDLYDPVTKERRALTRLDAEGLLVEGYMFYRSFPSRALGGLDVLKFALRKRWSELGWLLFCSAAATVLGMAVPLFVGILVEYAVPQGNRQLLFQLGLSLVGSALGIALFQLGQGLIGLRLESMTDFSTQAALWDRVLNLQPQFFKRFATGDLNARIAGIGEIRQKLSGTTLRTLFNGVFTTANLVLMYCYAPRLALVAVALALVVVLVTLGHGWLKLNRLSALQKLKGAIFGTVVQLVNGVAKLRVAGAEGRAFAHWSVSYSQLQRHVLGVQAIEDSLTAFNEIVPLVSSVLLFWVMYGTWQAGFPISAGLFLAFNAAYAIFIGGVRDLSNTAVNSLEVIDLWKRVEPVLTAPTEIDADKKDPGRLHGEVALEGVTFRYHPEGQPILKEVSLQVNPGEFIAIVGPSGGGKSTIFRLLLGFEKPELGTVSFDSQDFARLDVQAVRRQMGVVLQTTRLQPGSIYDNITKGAAITLKEAEVAAAAAGLAEDIAAMPMGMNTMVSEGGNTLSGGQRQRLLIAQALAMKPRILLFDEATSALDNRTQQIVSESLDRLQVTRVVIAHRLSTIRHADCIYVLEGGQVVQKGRYEELIAQEGVFTRLAARQLA